MKFTLLTILFLSCSYLAIAQSPDWTITANEEILSARLSTNGNYIVYIADKETDNVQCINTKTGAVVWTKTIVDYNEDFCGRMIDNEVYLLPNRNQYEFIKVSDGTILKSLPIVGETWDLDLNLRGTGDKPYFFGDFGVFYFSNGFQIIHLQNREIVYHSPCEVNSVKYEQSNHRLMILPDGTCDSLYVIDTTSGRVELSMELTEGGVDSRVRQHFVANGTQMFLFKEHNILCIDISKKEVSAILDIDPEDPDVYTTIASKNDLYLIVSEDDRQTLYRCSDGSRLWEAELPGMVDMARLYNNDKDLVLFTYEDDGRMVVHKLDMKTGKGQWSKALFQQDGDYEPAHLTDTETSSFSSGGGMVMTGIGPGGTPTFSYMPPVQTSYSRTVTPPKSSEGYAYLLDTASQSKLVIAMGGRIYSELKKVESLKYEYDGEGFVVLDLNDGSVVQYTQCPIIAESEQPGKYNAVKFMKTVSGDHAHVVVGVHDVYTISEEKIDRIAFNKEKDVVNVISSSKNKATITFCVNHDDKKYDYWLVEAKTLPVKRTLYGRSTEDNLVFADTNTTGFASMVSYNDGELMGYQLESGDVSKSRFASPMWKMSEDDIDKLDIGAIDDNRSSRDSLQGIRAIEGTIYLLGRYGIGKISADGKCRWSIGWTPNLAESARAPFKVGSYFIFSTGIDTRIIHDNCNEGRLVGEHEIDSDDVMILTDNTREIVIVDKSEGIIYGYHAK